MTQRGSGGRAVPFCWGNIRVLDRSDKQALTAGLSCRARAPLSSAQTRQGPLQRRDCDHGPGLLAPVPFGWDQGN